MLKSQSLQLKQSECRERLNTIASMASDKLTDEIKKESEDLRKTFTDLETQFRAALTSESAELSDTPDTSNEDGEAREKRALLDKVSINDYIRSANRGAALGGATAELNEALKVPAMGGSGGCVVPFELLLRGAPLTEKRADANTTTAKLSGGTAQRPILQRLFGPGILDHLGVRIDSVPVGQSQWPLLSGGVAPAQTAEGTKAADAVAATFTTQSLKPKRLTGVYTFTHEIAAQVSGLEEALRMDLRDAIASKMSEQIINGDTATNAHEPNGFLTTLTKPTDPSAVATYADFASSHAAAVDGIHAGSEFEVSSVVGVATYKYAAGIYNTQETEAATEAMARRSAMCVASSYIPAVKSKFQNAIYHAGMDTMRGDSIAAVWPGIELIRDTYTNASVGVKLTWVALWDAETAFRTDAYSRRLYQVAK